MKKGLSILLVAAALFGFYGGATNLNDVLACKDYWEKAGEESTANMNKLEDGLNQLKENEQAYLDGQDQLAEGEKTLADGEAQYAQGLADYEAAPGKLADARRQLAAGEEALADGKAQLAQGYKDYKEAPGNLAKLDESIKSLQFAKTSYEDYSTDAKTGEKGPSWKTGFEKTAEQPDYSDAGLRQAKGVITATVNAKKETLDAAAGLGEMTSSLSNKILTAKTYEDFNEALESGIEPLAKAAVKLNTLSEKAKAAVEAKSEDFNNAATLIGNPAARQAQIENVKGQKQSLEGKQKQLSGLQQVIGGYAKQAGSDAVVPAQLPVGDKVVDIPPDYRIEASKALANIEGLLGQISAGINQCDEGIEKLSDTLNLKKEVAQQIGSALAALGGSDQLSMVKSLDEDLYNDLTGDLAVLTLNEKAQPLWSDDATFAQTIGKFANDMGTLAKKLADSADEAASTSDKFDSWCKGYAQLKAGKDTLASGLSSGFKSALNNKTIRPVLNEKAPQLVTLLKAYSGNKLANDDLDAFNDDMETVAGTVIPNLVNVLKGIKNQGLKDYAAAPGKLAKGEKDLAAGKAKLADGYRQYNQGLADYEAAPGKLADAEKQLADGRQQLADGKAKLAEYEDGEQQVRDGLKTLTDTEADLELKSIADRLNGDVDFDNGDNHLELDEGLAAVDVGRGYQAEDGVLISDEIMARAVGTGALLGAGALAVLAAILSFLKKNKAAGIFAILAAAAGGFGAFYGTQAGTYFSSIAGSTVGATGWIAAGILAAVALVHAIVHFTAKKEA